MDRQIPQDIQNYPFDVIVVGAGINGTGIARDAAMRGLRVLLLDKEDISSGTTQWATRLIHGGLRYLQYYEFPLVRESLRDRELLFRIAPHLVRPLGFGVPIYDYMDRGPLLIRAGMILYDALSFEKTVGGHQMLSREETLERYPGLNPEGLKGAAFYYDGQAEYSERIAVENAISAKDHGAVVLNYAKVDRLLMEDGTVTGVEFSDELNGGKYKAFAPVTVNVAGPWVDEVLDGLQNRSENQMIGGTKGSHIVVDPFPGAPETALYVEAESDGRPYFIVPWNERYLIGTTDIRYDGDLDHVEADDDEVEYLINETNRVIQGANLSEEDILFVYSGVRPLPFKPEGDTSSVTRSHIIYDHSEEDPGIKGLISIIGGKLTTYRNLSRETVDDVYDKLHLHAPKSNTGSVPLPGGTTEDFDAFAAEFKAHSGLADEISERLLKLYGTRAPEVLAIADDDPDLKMPLSSPASVANGLIGAEVIWAFREEMAQKLTDVLLRRSMVGMGPNVGLDVDEAAAEIAVKHLGWDEQRAKKEVKEYREWIERYKPKQFREEEPATA